MSLKDKAKSMNAGEGIAFMNEREKGEVKNLNDKNLTVTDYDFIHGEDGDYIVFTVKEDDENFYFGASVMTDNFKKFTSDEKAEIQKDGLPIRLYERENKKGNRTYQAVTFYPES